MWPQNPKFEYLAKRPFRTNPKHSNFVLRIQSLSKLSDFFTPHNGGGEAEKPFRAITFNRLYFLAPKIAVPTLT